MRVTLVVLTMGIALCSGCNVSPAAPSDSRNVGAVPPYNQPIFQTLQVTPPAVLVISMLAIVRDSGMLRADFTLRETGGESGATLNSITFQESGGDSEFVDSGCWGDDGPFIAPNGTFDVRGLGYCQPVLRGKPMGGVATITVTYKQRDGSVETVRAAAGIR